MAIIKLGEVIAKSSDVIPHRTGYVYALVDAAEPARVRYIGSAWEPQARLYAHLRHSLTGRKLAAWLRSVEDVGGTVLMRSVAVGTDRAALYEIEGQQTALYRLLGMADLNGAFTHAAHSRV